MVGILIWNRCMNKLNDYRNDLLCKICILFFFSILGLCSIFPFQFPVIIIYYTKDILLKYEIYGPIYISYFSSFILLLFTIFLWSIFYKDYFEYFTEVKEAFIKYKSEKEKENTNGI